MGSMRKLKATLKYSIEKKYNHIMSNTDKDKEVKKPSKEVIEAAKAEKLKTIANNQTVKK